MKILFTLVLTSAFGTLFAQQNLITNGSFETETAAAGSAYYQLSATAAPDGWGFTPASTGSLTVATTAQPTEAGSWCIEFGTYGGTYDELTQSIQTVAGQTYDLSYYLEDTDKARINVETFDFVATWNGNVISGTQDLLNIPGTYTLYTATVTGSGGMDTLGMNGYDASSYGLLDNVSLTQAVPAPASVLALGLGVAGLVIRRRRNG